jgi:uncharacterized protein
MQRLGVLAIVLVSTTTHADVPKDGPCAGKTSAECARAAIDVQYGGHGVKQDKKRAAAMFQAACDAGELRACTLRADMGENSGLDEAGIRRLYDRACSSGDPIDCSAYAFHLKESHDADDVAEAYAMFQKLCLGGQGDACLTVADHSNSKAETVKWQRRGCEAKETSDCRKLDYTLYRDGDPALTPAQATRELEMLCDAGNADACEWAGDRHFAGKGAKPSRVDANVWAGKACEQGIASECNALGRRALFDGKPDKQRAQAWFQKACDAKDADGCEWLKRAQR